MTRTVKVAISLPADLLGRIDRVRRRRGETRSQYFRDAAAARLAGPDDQLVDEYRRGYEKQPESTEEIDAAKASAITVLASEPWD